VCYINFPKDKELSKIHAELVYQGDDKIKIFDYRTRNSTNGCWKRIKQTEIELKDKMRIRLGNK
jgi:hypothetical protein